MEQSDMIGRLISRASVISTVISEPENVCQVCRGTGWEFVEQVTETGQTYRAVRKCTACRGNHNKRVMETKALADIPDDRNLEAFDWGKYPGFDISLEREIVEKFVEHFEEFEAEGMGLFLTSKTRGSGKTFLASCIGGELINRYEASVSFVNASDLLDIAQRKTEDDPLERMISCRVLILDDLGQKQTGRDWLVDILFRIIDKRYQKKRVVIVTSNDIINELDFDARIIDRIYAMTCMIRLPEYCVRSKDAKSQKEAILHKLGIDLERRNKKHEHTSEHTIETVGR